MTGIPGKGCFTVKKIQKAIKRGNLHFIAKQRNMIDFKKKMREFNLISVSPSNFNKTASYQL